MTFPFSAKALRFALLALVGTTGILTSSCVKEPEPIVYKDYSAIDDAIIQKYLTDNNITTAQKQSSGLYYVPTLTNAGAVRAVKGSTVSVLYTGMLMDGTVFDASSKNGNVPISFILGTGRVITGWDQGIALMHKGDKGMLLIPSALAYGPGGSGRTIPPNTVIRFEVELVDVN